METKKTDVRFSVIAAIVLLAAFSRLIPHMYNFSPLSAIGLFGAAHFSKKWYAFLIPISATWLSDLFINNVIYAQYNLSFIWFYKGFYWQYGSYVLITFVAFFIFKKLNTQRVIAGALMSSAIFFLITNFACFPANPIYSQNFSGLLTCYAVGIPFFKGTLLGDLVYSFLLFGSFALLKQRFTILKLAH